MSESSDDEARQQHHMPNAAQSYPSFAAAATGLFPAYTSVTAQPGPSWLQNTSFTAVNASTTSAKLPDADEARSKHNMPPGFHLRRLPRM